MKVTTYIALPKRNAFCVLQIKDPSGLSFRYQTRTPVIVYVMVMIDQLSKQSRCIKAKQTYQLRFPFDTPSPLMAVTFGIKTMKICGGHY